MQSKHVTIYVLILLLILVYTFLSLPKSTPSSNTSTSQYGNQTQTNTTIGSNTLNATNTTNSTLTNSTNSTQPISYGSCISNANYIPIANGNFSTGTFANWTTKGQGFGTAPLNMTYANKNFGYYNHTWTGYNGTFFATTFHGGIGLSPGNITSDVFQAVLPYLSFRIVSPQDNLLYVQILQDNVSKITVHYNTYAVKSNLYPTSQFINVSIPLGSVLCQNIRVKVVSGVVGSIQTSKEYIAAGDFALSRKPSGNPTAVVNQSIS